MSEEMNSELVQRFHEISGVPDASENMREFLRLAPEPIADRFLDLLETINLTPHVDYKVKALIRMVLSMVLGHERGVVAWSLAALKAGATQDEVIETLYTVIPQVGAIPIIKMLPHAIHKNLKVEPDSGE